MTYPYRQLYSNSALAQPELKVNQDEEDEEQLHHRETGEQGE